MENQKFTKNIIPVEIELGFIRIPNRDKKLFPAKDSKILVYFGGSEKSNKLSYSSKHQRITGLVQFFRLNKAGPKDILEFEKIGYKKFKLFLKKLKSKEKEKAEFTQEEVRQILDLSGLSTKTKGDIVEDRIKELILLYGNGLLNVYKPSSDIEGIDLIIIKRGIYQPIFLQIKSNYHLYGGRNLIVQIKQKSFRPNHTLFIVGAYFNPNTLELDDKLFFISSEKVRKNSNVVKLKRGELAYRLTVSLKEGSSAKLTEYIIKKIDFVNMLFEKFKTIEKQ